MSKIKITKAMVDAVEQFLHSSAPPHYDLFTPEKQLQVRRDAVRTALIVAAHAVEEAAE